MNYSVKKFRGHHPREAFVITTPDGKMLLDIYPSSIVKELNKLRRDIQNLETVRDRLLENARILKGPKP